MSRLGGTIQPLTTISRSRKMPSLYFRRELSGLRPVDQAGHDALRKIKIGELVRVKLGRNRNVLHHRKFFALLNLIFENQSHYRSVDELLSALKFSIGHVNVIRTKTQEFTEPKSISFAAMSQDEFDDFYRRAIDFIAAEVIPGINVDDLRREVEDLCSMRKVA